MAQLHQASRRIRPTLQWTHPCVMYFVAGLSPRLMLNDDYQGIIELIGEEMAAGLEAAQNLEAERERASNLQLA